MLWNLAESFIDNVIRDMVDEPAIGSVVYCDLIFGFAEHSGIYIGNDEIVHLNRYGDIEIIDSDEFLEGATAISIYVSCDGDSPVGCLEVAKRAKSMVGDGRNYNFLLDNCHQFTAGCLLDDFENSSVFLWMLKDDCKEVLDADTWRVWDR